MRRFFGLTLLLATGAVLAEQGILPRPPIPSMPGPYPPYVQQRDPLGYDPDYLTGKKEEAPKSQNLNTGQTRYPDQSNEEYNSEKRQEWIDNCAEERKQDSKAFRDCFERQKKQFLKELREKFDAVERRQAQPLRSAPNPLLDDMKRRPKDEED